MLRLIFYTGSKIWEQNVNIFSSVQYILYFSNQSVKQLHIISSRCTVRFANTWHTCHCKHWRGVQKWTPFISKFDGFATNNEDSNRNRNHIWTPHPELAAISPISENSICIGSSSTNRLSRLIDLIFELLTSDYPQEVLFLKTRFVLVLIIWTKWKFYYITICCRLINGGIAQEYGPSIFFFYTVL
jgi:hypothetical protein